MRYGSPYGAGYGNPSRHVEYVTFDTLSGRYKSTVIVKFKPRTGYGNAYFGIACNSRPIKVVYVVEGQECVETIPLSNGITRQSIYVYRLGHCSDSLYDFGAIASIDEQFDSNRVRLEWDFTPRVLEPESQFINGVCLSGVNYYNTERVTGFPTRGNLLWSVSGTGVLISKYGLVMCSGIGTGNVSLIADNSTGITGIIALGAGIPNVTSGIITLSWPSYAEIFRNGISVDRSYFNGKTQGIWNESTDLTSGNYSYKLRMVSDCNDIGDFSSELNAAINTAPESPYDLTYFSGNSTGPIVKFKPSTTDGTTHSIYLKRYEDQYFDVITPAATVASGTEFATIPNCSIGDNLVMIRASKDGVEEKNNEILQLSFGLGGAFIYPLPNTPSLRWVTILSGNEISVRATYPVIGEGTSAVSVKLYARQNEETDFSLSKSESLQTLTREMKYADIRLTSSGIGWHTVKLTAFNVSGTESAASEGQIYIDSTNLPAPTIKLVIARE